MRPLENVLGTGVPDHYECMNPGEAAVRERPIQGCGYALRDEATAPVGSSQFVCQLCPPMGPRPLVETAGAYEDVVTLYRDSPLEGGA